MPVVSPSPMWVAPSAATSPASRSTWAAGTSPSKGQPKAVASPTSNALPAALAISAISAASSSERAIGRLRFFRLWVSEQETTASIASTPVAAARSAPRALGTSAQRCSPGTRAIPATTSSASASCGTARGLTNDVT